MMGLPAQAARNHQGKKAQKKMIQTSIVSRSPIFSESAISACVCAGILASRQKKTREWRQKVSSALSSALSKFH
jgi:hypothetical protein